LVNPRLAWLKISASRKVNATCLRPKFPLGNGRKGAVTAGGM
jgi:hypothetical protein